jgi:hypothetical protein
MLKSRFDQTLAIIEGSFYTKGMHARALGNELPFLDLAYPTTRKEKNHLDASDTGKTVSHCTAGVP